MIKNFTIDNTKFSINISGDKPQNAETFTPSFYEGYPELKEIKPSFIDSDGTTDITFLKDNIYYYIQINQSTTSTLKNESSEAVYFSTKGDSETSVVYLRFNTEQELSFFITRHIFPELYETYAPKGEFSNFTTTKQILDWWNTINTNRSIFDESNTQENVCYGFIESSTSPVGKGYNKHTPPSYYDGITWDRDLPNLITTRVSPKSFDYVSFRENDKPTKWKADMPALEVGNRMFENDHSLTSFTSDCPNLKTSSSMFSGCWNLSEFQVSSLENLCIASGMFYNASSLESFDYKLPLLSIANQMFSGCTNLSSFEGYDLPSAQDAEDMFNGCKSLISFDQKCEKLIKGSRMF